MGSREAQAGQDRRSPAEGRWGRLGAPDWWTTGTLEMIEPMGDIGALGGVPFGSLGQFTIPAYGSSGGLVLRRPSVMVRKLLSHVHLAGQDPPAVAWVQYGSPRMSFIGKDLLAVTVTCMLKHLLGEIIAGGNSRTLISLHPYDFK
jgi:hypothetical protein